jgi:hypothetical protein
MEKRNWTAEPFIGSDEGIIAYVDFKKYVYRTISIAGATRDGKTLIYVYICIRRNITNK